MAKRSCDAGNANTADASASMALLRLRSRSGSSEPSRASARTRAVPKAIERGVQMHRGITALVIVGLLAAAAAVGATTLGPGNGTASSHREAPLIAEDPSADLTDLYAFRSPDKPNTVTILANVIPGEDPAAGPNWYTFSPSARYNLKIDTDGDARTDVTYQFQFRTKTGPFFLGDTAQPFTVTRIAGRSTKVVARGTTPPNNIGPRSTPNYRSLAAKSVVPLAGGGQAFAGQRDDPFFGDIGAIFDLVAIRKGTGNMGGGKDFFAGYGVHTIGVQLPIADLKAKTSTIGVWSSVDRRKVTTRSTAGARNSGTWIQVNRLANPLVNEVVIPTGLKDQWNGLAAWNEGRFRQYYETPILAAVINKLYKLDAPETGRDDLVAVLLTGVPKLNFTGSHPADLLRLNLAIPFTKNPNRMAVLAGDNQGWPNGRRLGDDVIDIAEQAVGGFLKGTKLPLGDGVNADDRKLMPSFPYIADPQSGFENTKAK